MNVTVLPPWLLATVSAATILVLAVIAVALRPGLAPRSPHPHPHPHHASPTAGARTSAAGRARRGDLRSDTLIELLDDIARDVRVGASLHAAVDAALVRRPSCLEQVNRSLRCGGTLEAALARAAVDGPDERLVVQTLLACCRSGGRLAAPVERAALVLRERRTWQQERHAQSAQARLSALVMTLLPLGFALWGAASSARVRSAYGSSSAVIICTCAGLGLNAVGWWWMRWLVQGGRR